METKTIALIAGGSALATIVIVLVIIAIVYVLRKKYREKYTLLPLDGALKRKVNVKELPSTEEQQSAAMLNAQLFLRSSNYRMVRELVSIGRRSDKFYFHVNDKSTKVLMSMSSKAEDSKLPVNVNSVRNDICDLLTNLKHSLIYPTRHAEFLQGRELLVIFRDLNSNGSLRDIIYDVKPTLPTQEKYRPKKNKPFKPQKIALYGRQIITALIYLKNLGFPFGHLHSGNVIVKKDRCMLTDYENGLLGKRPQLYDVFERLSRRGIKDVRGPTGWEDVIGLGSILFEMLTGAPFRKLKSLKNIHPSTSIDVREILDKIFDPTVNYTLEDVSNHPFFASVVLKESDEADDTSFSRSAEKTLKAIAAGEVPVPKTGRLRRKDSTTAATSSSSSSILSATGSSPSSSSPASPYSSSSNMRTPYNSYQNPPPSSPSTLSSSSYSSISSPSSAPKPPPAPAPPMPSSPSAPPAAASGERSVLLSSIRQGKKLKKATTNDRSSPLI